MRIHSSSTNLNSAIFSCTLLDMVFKEGCNLEKQREERGTPDLHLYQMSDRGSSTELGVEVVVVVKYM